MYLSLLSVHYYRMIEPFNPLSLFVINQDKKSINHFYHRRYIFICYCRSIAGPFQPPQASGTCFARLACNYTGIAKGFLLHKLKDIMVYSDSNTPIFTIEELYDHY